MLVHVNESHSKSRSFHADANKGIETSLLNPKESTCSLCPRLEPDIHSKEPPVLITVIQSGGLRIRKSFLSFVLLSFLQTLDIIRPYLSSLFHENGAKKTVPVCPVAVVPWFHPYSSFHSYSIGDKDCNVIATQGLPFFLERYGPKWTEYTTTGHEQLPGHHLEVGTLKSR